MNQRAIALLGCLSVALAVALYSWRQGPAKPSTHAPRFPLLPPISSACPVSSVERDAWVGHAVAEAAGLRRRYAFDSRSGVQAQAVFVEIAGCLPAEAAASFLRRGAELRARIERDYQSHRVSLSAALEREDWSAVKENVTWLRGLIVDPPPEFSAWLRGLERKAEAQER